MIQVFINVYCSPFQTSTLILLSCRALWQLSTSLGVLRKVHFCGAYVLNLMLTGRSRSRPLCKSHPLNYNKHVKTLNYLQTAKPNSKTRILNSFSHVSHRLGFHTCQPAFIFDRFDKSLDCLITYKLFYSFKFR